MCYSVNEIEIRRYRQNPEKNLGLHSIEGKKKKQQSKLKTELN